MIKKPALTYKVTLIMSGSVTFELTAANIARHQRSLSVTLPRRRPYIEPLAMGELPNSRHSRSLTPTRPRVRACEKRNSKTTQPMPVQPMPDSFAYTPLLKKKPTNYTLYFDTETTGLPYEGKGNTKQFKPLHRQPYITQMSYVLFDHETYDIITIGNAYICLKDPSLVTPFITGKTGITPEMCGPDATNIVKVLCVFIRAWSQCRRIIGHNIEFDLILVTNDILRNKAEILAQDPELEPYIDLFMVYRSQYIKPRNERDYTLLPKTTYCTMWATTQFCGLKFADTHLTKWPRLEELYRILFREEPPQPLHNSMIDTLVTMRCYLKYALKKDIHNVKFNRMVKKGTELAAL